MQQTSRNLNTSVVFGFVQTRVGNRRYTRFHSPSYGKRNSGGTSHRLLRAESHDVGYVEVDVALALGVNVTRWRELDKSKESI